VLSASRPYDGFAIGCDGEILCPLNTQNGADFFHLHEPADFSSGVVTLFT
jgi:hypothetical protein